MTTASKTSVVLVTGARTGVGLELTRRLVSEGRDVVT
jgi:NAD(P)-dependent dehydrogenase (short-subunit alcohol dehydrogenase family)